MVTWIPWRFPQQTAIPPFPFAPHHHAIQKVHRTWDDAEDICTSDFGTYKKLHECRRNHWQWQLCSNSQREHIQWLNIEESDQD
jgi:transposase